MRRLLLSAVCVAALFSQTPPASVPLDTLPLSSALSPDGKFLLVLNCGLHPPSISVIRTDSMKETARVPVADAWLGLAFSPDGQHVYSSGGSRNSVFDFSFSSQGELKLAREILNTPGTQPAPMDFIGDVAVSPDGRRILAADLFHDRIIVISPQSGQVTGRFKTGRRPYRILFHPDGKSYFVSSWADASVYLHDTETGYEMGRVRLGPHPTDMAISSRKIPEQENPWQSRLFVAAANTNNVFVVGVDDSRQLTNLEVLNVGFTARQPAGMSPSGLALSADQTKLLIACSDANVVAVADLSDSRSSLAGFIPAGGYPTGVRMLGDGRSLILNGRGSLSVIDPLTEETLDGFTRTAMERNPYHDSILETKSEQRSSIEHVVYIVTEGRHPIRTANRQKLAREFVHFENFHPNGDTNAEGHYWAVAGLAPDFTQRLAPAFAAGRLKYNGFDGNESANLPPAGYLWSNAASAGLSVRTYGELVENRPTAGPDGVQVARVKDPSLQAITNTRFRGLDPAYPDTERARVFLDELKLFEATAKMPSLMMIHLGDDNDAALGMIVEGVSKSRFWASTAIFAVDTGGPNAELLVLSPFTRRGVVDRNAYDHSSVLRTIELILDMHPMTIFDAAARPLAAAFAPGANPAPYTAEKPAQ
jgi:DNA-binding beta-propeller fold protein YncE